MKHNTPTHMHRHLRTALPRRRDGEFAVNARLLYPFIAHPMVSSEEWIESLFHITSSRQYPTKFRLMVGDDGDLFLSEDLASYSAQLCQFRQRTTDPSPATPWVNFNHPIWRCSRGAWPWCLRKALAKYWLD